MTAPAAASRRTRRLSPARTGLALALLSALSLPVLAGEDKPAPPVSSSKALKLSITGQILGNWQDASNGLQVRRLRPGLSGEVRPGLRFKVSAEMAKSPFLLDALVELDLAEPVSLRFGQFLVPFGLENVTSVSDLDLVNRALVVEALSPSRDIKSQGRDVGLAAFGKASVFEYALGVVNGSGINKADTNKAKDVVGRLLVKPLPWLSVGGSLYQGRQNPSAAPATLVDRDRAGLELAVQSGRITAKAELIGAKDGAVKRSGWYALAGAFVDRARTVQPVVRVESLDPDTSLPDDRHSAWTLGLNWFLGGKTKLQVNYERHRLPPGTTSNDLYAQFQVFF